MPLSQASEDIRREIAQTKTVGASISTFMTDIHNRMTAALRANGGFGNLQALRDICQDFNPENQKLISAAIANGTSIGAQDRDVDPDAPPPAMNPGVLGRNQYGSKGPEDTDTNPTKSSGAAGRETEGMGTSRDIGDQEKPGAKPDGTVHLDAGLQTHAQHNPQDVATRSKPSADYPVTTNSEDAPALNLDLSRQATQSAEEQKDKPPSATSVGEQHIAQDHRPGEERTEADQHA